MNINFGNFEFEPVDLDSELFLTEVPMDLLKATIAGQFDDPLENRRTDYVQSFITKYDFSKENGHEDDQYVYDDIYDDFVKFMMDIFDEKLDVSFPTIDSMSDDNALELIQLTYRFFIKNIKKNFTTLIKNHIDNDREVILSRFEQKRDVTSMTFREEIDDEDDITILSNLGDIIHNYLNQEVIDFTVDQFLEGCVGKSLCLETSFVMSKYESFVLTGNFIRKYVDMIDSTFYYEIESSIRNHILKKYGNKRKMKPVTPADSEEEAEYALDSNGSNTDANNE